MCDRFGVAVCNLVRSVDGFCLVLGTLFDQILANVFRNRKAIASAAGSQRALVLVSCASLNVFVVALVMLVLNIITLEVFAEEGWERCR